jgi:phage protein D
MSRAVATPVFDPAGLNSTKTVNQVKIIQSENMHDTAIITMRGESTSAPELQPGVPMLMQYGWATIDVNWFYGYVDHVEKHYDRTVPDPSSLEDVVCLGASYALKQPFTGSWSSVQASALVQHIAQRYLLASLIEVDDYVWSQLSNPGSSAWTFLVQLANKLGYTFCCNKTLIRFTSIDSAMRQNWMGMPVFQSRNSAQSFALQTITDFQAITGETLSAGGTKAIRNISGLDLTSGQIVSATNNGALGKTILGAQQIHPFFTQQISDTVVSSQGSAQATLAGVTQANRFNYQATATLSGMTCVCQGMPIVLLGIDSNNDGMWWVQEVTHKFSSPGYSMDVSLGRDSKGNSGLLPIQGTSIAYSPTNPYAYAVVNAPPSRLVSQRWRAANQFNVSVSN